MKRLFLFLGALSWGARLQMLALALIVGFYAWIDFGKGFSHVTAGVVIFSWFIGWLMKPLMVSHAKTTFRIWSAFGIVVVVAYVLGRNQWWWGTALAHFAREFFMLLDLSCGYWFVSELRIQQEHQIERLIRETDEGVLRDEVQVDPFV